MRMESALIWGISLVMLPIPPSSARWAAVAGPFSATLMPILPVALAVATLAGATGAGV
jgi:hypothetical protein